MQMSDGRKTMLCCFAFIFVLWRDINVAQGFSRGVTREIWQSLPGNHVCNLTSSSRYQETPNIRDTMNHFDANVDIGDDYGQRLTAFYRLVVGRTCFHRLITITMGSWIEHYTIYGTRRKGALNAANVAAPETGDYVFYMSCRDECELWLSADDRTDNKKRIIFVPFGLNLTWNEWERNAAQISSPINLVSGEFYFMQAIMKAGSSPSDHLGVGVRQPNGKKYQPILNPDLYYEIPERRSTTFLLIRSKATLIGHVMYARATVSNLVCSMYCARDLNCQSYNYHRERGTCELNNDATDVNNAKGLVPNRDVDYYKKLEPKLERSHDRAR